MLPPEILFRAQQQLLQLRTRYPDARLEPQSIPGSAPIFRCTVGGELRWIPGLPGEPVLCTTLQEARRKVLTYDVQHLPPLQPGFGARPQEADLPSVYGPPAKALFEVQQLVRIPVDVDAPARAFLDQANQQTRIFDQALSEAFGHLAGVERLTIAYQQRADIDVATLCIQAVATNPTQHHCWHVRTDELTLRNANGEIAFQARYAAAELARLYIEHINR